MSVPNLHGQDRPALSVSSILGAALLLSIMDALAKWLGRNYSPVEIAFFRYAFSSIPIIVLIMSTGGLKTLRTRRPLLHTLRAVLLLASLLSFFTGLQHLPLAVAIAALYTAPLITAMLSGPLLGEQASPRRLVVVGFGLAGMLIILRPDGGAFRPEVAWVMIAAVCIALAMILTRRMASSETNAAMVSYSNFGAGAVTLLLLIPDWQTPNTGDLPLFVAVGVLGGAAAILAIIAYRHTSPTLVAPFEYTALVWGALFGWLLWEEELSVWFWLGSVIIIVSNLYLTRHETSSQGRGAA